MTSMKPHPSSVDRQPPLPAQTAWSGRRVTVMGLGQFGGGVGVVRFLLERGARVTLTDLQTADTLADSLAQIPVEQLEHLVLGEHREQDFLETDLVVISPAVRAESHPLTQRTLAAGIPVTTEMNLFWTHCRAQKVIVTGTVGKSTTSSLIHHLLRSQGTSVRLGGNIGISLLPEVDELTEQDWVILELSSFQLAALDQHCPQPEIAVVTNFFPNHLAWHGEVDHYRWSKQTALRWQRSTQLAVLNSDDPDVCHWMTSARRIEFGTNPSTSQFVRIENDRLVVRVDDVEEDVRLTDLNPELQHRFQRSNVAAALGAVAAIKRETDRIPRQPLKTFQTLPHRLETVGLVNGVLFVNDSKATTPQATLAALDAVQQPIVLIAGGKDQRVCLSDLCQQIARRVHAVALIGETSANMLQLIHAANPCTVAMAAESLEEAFEWCVRQAAQGTTILLSPGCSSHPHFLNYEQRGELFRQLTRRLQHSPSPQSSPS